MKLEKEFVKKELKLGKSIRQIARENNIPNKTLNYWINKWNFKSKYDKPQYNEDYFSKIDTPNKAYILGFILGDGYLTKESFELTVSLKDMGVSRNFQNQVGGNVNIDKTFDNKTKRFPRARISVKNKRLIKDLNTLFGGHKKEDRHIPIIKKSLQKYLVLGFFDAEGTIVFGKRKNRNYLWSKLQITSQLKMLEGIQNILLDWEISSSIKKRRKENCYDLYIRNKDIVRFCNKVFETGIFCLGRKQDKIRAFLRLKSDENGGNS